MVFRLAFVLPLAAVAQPSNPVKKDDVWDWCDQGKGQSSVTVWPEFERESAITVSPGDQQWLSWGYPVKRLEWICDGMEDVQSSKSDLPHEWWTVEHTVAKKPPLFRSSGRLHWTTYDVPRTAVSRNIITRGGEWVDAKTNDTILLEGANVVMKGPPWLPETTGDTICLDRWFSNFTCYTFNKHDALHITQEMGWNYIRLGVAWAGAQPTPEAKLDEDWVRRLHAILDLANEYGIHVVLDVHQDAVGTAYCGEGVPQWFSAIVHADKIGKPPATLPFTKKFWPEQEDGKCGFNDTETWALHAGDPDYNTKNECCLRFNGGGSSWARCGFTWAAQEIMASLFSGQGRHYYQRYIGLLAKAVENHPAAVAIELFNEPPSIDRMGMYRTWKECYDQVRTVSADLAVSVQDTGQSPLPLGNLDLMPDQVAWLKSADHLFYAFHWYSFPPDPNDAVKYALRYKESWGMPLLATEMGECKFKVPAVAAGIGYSFWEYSNFCDTAPSHACLPGGACDFGACITGTNGNSWKNLTCPPDGSEPMGSSNPRLPVTPEDFAVQAYWEGLLMELVRRAEEDEAVTLDV